MPRENPNEPRLAIVSDWLTVPGGAEETLRHIHAALPEAPIHVGQFRRERFPWLAEADVREHWIGRLPKSRTRHQLYAPLLADAYRAMDLREHDAVLAFHHTFAHHARPRPDALHIAYYCTPTRALWLPEIDGRAGSGPLRAAIVRRLKRLDLVAAARPNVVWAISKTAADRVEAIYGRRVDAVIHPPVETDRWRGIPRRSDRLGYVVWGRLIPYKRFDLAIEAARIGGFPLQIVGAGPEEARLKALAHGLPNVRFHGRLADADLDALLAEARGVLFPGYEDFGIVPVEAMAAGLPVVAYGAGGAGETVGDPALGPSGGALFDAQTPDALADAVRRLERAPLDPDALRARAEPFGVQRFRRELLARLGQAMARPRGIHPMPGLPTAAEGP